MFSLEASVRYVLPCVMSCICVICTNVYGLSRPFQSHAMP